MSNEEPGKELIKENFGVYVPNLDVSVVDDKDIEVNFNFSPSTDEEAAYEKKYGKKYPYKTSMEFRELVRTVNIDYFQMLKAKVSEGDEAWLATDALWTIINTAVATIVASAGATAIYKAYKCCSNLEDILNILFNIYWDPVEKVFKYIFRDDDDDEGNNKITNPKQNKLRDYETDPLLPLKWNIRPIVTESDDGIYREESFVDVHPYNPLPEVDPYATDPMRVSFSGIEKCPNFGGCEPISSETKVPADIGLQARLNGEYDNPLRLEFQSDPEKGAGYKKTKISSRNKFGDGFQIKKDTTEGIWKGVMRKIYPNFSDIHFKKETLCGYDPTQHPETGAIKIGTITKKHLDTNAKIDGGNIVPNSINANNIKDHTVNEKSIKQQTIKSWHIARDSITSQNIKSVDFENLNSTVFDRLRDDVNFTKLTDLADGDNHKAETAYHFDNYDVFTLDETHLFTNGTTNEKKDDLIVMSWAGNKDRDGINIKLYKLYLDPQKKEAYFKKFNDGVKTVDSRLKDIENDLDTQKKDWNYLISNKYTARVEQNYVAANLFEGNNIKLVKSGFYCNLKGEVVLKQNGALRNIVTIARPKSVLEYYPPHQNVIETIFDPERKRMYHIIISKDNGYVGLLSAYELRNGSVVKLGELSAGTTISFNFDYLNDEVKLRPLV